MLEVTHPDQLSIWLEQNLAPIFDGEPDKLAKYIMALLRQNSEIDKLKAYCSTQLMDFLSDETELFVEEIFAAVASGEYKNVSAVEETEPHGNSMLRQESNDNFSTSFEEDEEGYRCGDGESSFHEQRRRRHVELDADEEDSHHSDSRNSYQRAASSDSRGQDGRSGPSHGRDRSYDSNSSQRQSNRAYPQQSSYPKHNQHNMLFNCFPHSGGCAPFPQGASENNPPHFGGGRQGGWDGPQYPPNFGGHAFCGSFNQPNIAFGGNMPMPMPGNNDGFYGDAGAMAWPPQCAPMTEPQPPAESSSGVPASAPVFKPHPPAARKGEMSHQSMYGYGDSSNSAFPERSQSVQTFSNYSFPAPVNGNPFCYEFNESVGSSAIGYGEQQQQSGHGSSGQSSYPKNSNASSFNSCMTLDTDVTLPGFRRTLRCTGIPSTVTEEQLKQHFLVFGRIVGIRCAIGSSNSPNNSGSHQKQAYGECLVQFVAAEDARKCISSSDPVLNNRFIKVYYCNTNIYKLSDVPRILLENAQVEKDRKAASVPDADSVVRTVPPVVRTNSTDSDGVGGGEEGSMGPSKKRPYSTPIPSARDKLKKDTKRIKTDRMAEVVQRKYYELQKLRQKANDIWKQKEVMLQDQIKKYRDLMEHCAKKSGAASMELMDSLEVKVIHLQSQLSKLREENEAQNNATEAVPVDETKSTAVSGAVVSTSASSGGVQTATASATSAVSPITTSATPAETTSPLTVSALPPPAVAAAAVRVEKPHPGGRFGGRGAGRGRMGGRIPTGRGRGRGAVPSRSLDFRTTVLSVSSPFPSSGGFAGEESAGADVDTVSTVAQEHFKRFGPVKSLKIQPAQPAEGVESQDAKQIIIAYVNRRDAERALREGSLFDGHPLTMSWCTDTSI